MSDPITRLNAALEGRYRVERKLGEGGMATVYLADDLRHERKVALKVLKPELAALVGADRFLAEIKTTANLQHPHILALHDSGEADGLLFYVMPYVEGESLRERLDREHELPVHEAVTIATKVAGALQAAHDRGVIHRDIKPANILLAKGEPVVSDFGIALALSSAGGHRLTETGLSLGTPHYMSPEQATGDQSVGPPTDIWAVGCVLYEMLVGEPPYTGSTPQAILGRIITGEAPSASSDRSSVPPNVDAAIRRALEKRPADRFSGADGLARALADPGFRHGPDAAGAPATAPDGSRPGMRAAVAMTALAGALAVGLAWSLLRPPSEAASAFRLSILPPPAAVLSTLWPLAVSPDGMTVAFLASPPEGGRQLYLRRLDDDFTSTAVQGSDGAHTVFFSSDGEWVAFFTPRELRRARVSGGAALTVCPCPGLARGAAWTASDTIVYSSSPDGSLWQVEASGGNPTPLTTLDAAAGEVQHGWPQALPGGGILYGVRFSTGSEDEIRLLSDGESRTVRRGTSQVRYVDGRLLFMGGASVFSVPFDPARATALGEPVEVLSDVLMGGNLVDRPLWAAGRSGTLAYVATTATGYRGSLMQLGRDGGAEVVLPPRERRILSPRVSPDGTSLLYGDGAQVWTLDLASRRERQLTFQGENETPIWTPDGDRVLFRSNRFGASNLFMRSAGGLGDAERITESANLQLPASVTPDGGTLVYSEFDLSTGADVWTMPLDGSAPPTPLLDDPASTWAGGLSRDGRWLVYTSDESGRSEVYVMAFPGGGGRWKISTDGGSLPVWSPRGDELFYRERDRMMVVTVRLAGPTFDWDPPRELFTERDLSCCAGLAPYDVAADGQSFFMIQGAEEVREIRVVRGWENRTGR